MTPNALLQNAASDTVHTKTHFTVLSLWLLANVTAASLQPNRPEEESNQNYEKKTRIDSALTEWELIENENEKDSAEIQ